MVFDNDAKEKTLWKYAGNQNAGSWIMKKHSLCIDSSNVEQPSTQLFLLMPIVVPYQQRQLLPSRFVLPALSQKGRSRLSKTGLDSHVFAEAPAYNGITSEHTNAESETAD